MSNLASVLRQLDASQVSIQRAASCMMKMYDSSAYGAVTEWRNALQSASTEHLMPLLYVCNEVLQTSKRNRGNKFLEAYSPVLGQSLQHMAIRVNDPNLTEKIRRVVKIWGDRQVFSTRFVNELLTGLEPYRKKQPQSTVSHHQKNQQNHQQKQQQLPLITPQIVATIGGELRQEDSGPTNNSSKISSIKKKTNQKRTNVEDEDEDFIDTLDLTNDVVGETDVENRAFDDDDDDDVFGENSQRSDQLRIEISVDDAVVQTGESFKNKRRRGSMESAASNASTKKAKKVLKRSQSHFMDIWNRLKQLKQTFDLAQLNIQRIGEKLQNDNEGRDLENLVGDELLTAQKQNDTDIQTIAEQRVILYQTAIEQYALEQQIQKQYYPWFEAALQQDAADLAFCNTLESTIQSFQPIHAQIVKAHIAMKMDEDDRKRRDLERERQRREQEEAEKFRREALAKETEAKPGMVWNPTTREYQSLNTDESWRD